MRLAGAGSAQLKTILPLLWVGDVIFPFIVATEETLHPDTLTRLLVREGSGENFARINKPAVIAGLLVHVFDGGSMALPLDVPRLLLAADRQHVAVFVEVNWQLRPQRSIGRCGQNPVQEVYVKTWFSDVIDDHIAQAGKSIVPWWPNKVRQRRVR